MRFNGIGFCKLSSVSSFEVRWIFLTENSSLVFTCFSIFEVCVTLTSCALDFVATMGVCGCWSSNAASSQLNQPAEHFQVKKVQLCLAIGACFVWQCLSFSSFCPVVILTT